MVLRFFPLCAIVCDVFIFERIETHRPSLLPPYSSITDFYSTPCLDVLHISNGLSLSLYFWAHSWPLLAKSIGLLSTYLVSSWLPRSDAYGCFALVLFRVDLGNVVISQPGWSFGAILQFLHNMFSAVCVQCAIAGVELFTFSLSLEHGSSKKSQEVHCPSTNFRGRKSGLISSQCQRSKHKKHLSVISVHKNKISHTQYVVQAIDLLNNCKYFIFISCSILLRFCEQFSWKG